MLASGTIFVVASIVLAGIVPIVYIMGTPNPRYGAWWGALAIAIASGLRISWILGAGAPRLFAITTWAFIYVFLGIAPIVQLRLGLFPETTPNLPKPLLATGVAIAAVGVAGVALGEMLKQTEVTSGTARVIRKDRWQLLCLVALFVAAYWITKVGFSNFFGARFSLSIAEGRAFSDTTVRSTVRAAASMSVLVCSVAAIQLRQMGDRTINLIFLPLGLVLITAFNLLTAARFAFGTALIGLLAALGVYATRSRFRVAALASIGMFLLVFSTLGTGRATGATGFRVVSSIEGLTSGDYDAYAQIVNTALYTDQIGLTWGRQAAGAVLFWVPRSIWADKPVDTGILLGTFREYGFTNLSAPLWAEAFINGGWVLLVLAMVLYGRVITKADRRIAVTLENGGKLPVLACILPGYLLIVLRGSLLQSMANLAVIVVCAWFITESRNRKVASRKRRTPLQADRRVALNRPT